jgi:two-component system NtrC family sensor kinase
MPHVTSAFGKTSIKTKVTVTVLILITTLVLTVSWTLFSYFRSLLVQNISRQQFVLVSEIADQLNGRIDLARRQLALSATEIDSAVLADPKKLENVLIHASPANMIFDAGYLIIGTNGRVLAASLELPDQLDTDLHARDYVKVPLKTGKPYTSDPFRLTAQSNAPVIAMVVPVRDDSDRIICLLAGYHSLGTNQFLTGLSARQLGSGSYLYLLHERTLLMHPDTTRIMETIPEGVNRGIEKALKGFEGSLENYNSKGLHILSSFKRVGQTDWILAANSPYDEAFKPLNHLALNALLISVLGILLSLLAVWYVTSRLTLPIRQLTAQVDAVSSNNTEWLPIESVSGDEIGRLAGAFNAMMAETEAVRQLLKDEKDFISGIIQNSAAPMFVIDSNHTILFWNNSLAKLTGKSSFEMMNTRQQWTPFYASKRPLLADLVIEQKLGCMNEYYSDFESSRYVDGAFKAEGWFDSIGGQRRYLLFEAAPVRNSRNEIIAAVETLEDITERKTAEDALTASENRLNHIVGAAQDAIIMLDTDGLISLWNDSAVRIFGYTFQEVAGRNFHQILTPERYHTDHVPAFEKFRKTGEGAAVGQLLELFALRSNGEEFPVELALSKVRIHDQWHAIGVLRDITSRKQSEEALSAARKELEAKHEELGQLFDQVAYAKREWENTLDHLRDFVILADAEHRVRRYNRLLADSTGREVNDLVGADWRELIAEAGFRFISFNGKSGEIHHHRSGRSYDITIYPIADNGPISGHVISINDTTELRCATQELEQAYAELKAAQLQIFQQEKMASIGQLAAGVAHEINNPMGFISSNLGTLGKYVDRLAEYISAGDQVLGAGNGGAEAEQVQELKKRLKITFVLDDSRNLIAESQDGAGRVRRIVQDLKSFSRVDHAECAQINLNEALETTINIAWNEIKYVAALNREFGDIPPIKCYPQQLNQVFLNLLVNAAHAMGKDLGTITVRTWSEGDDVCVSVADTGCGIPEANQQRVFEPFFTTKEVGKGTGLGLSISYEIIRKHGGQISVESEEGRGTTFTVRLPVEGTPQEQTDV